MKPSFSLGDNQASLYGSLTDPSSQVALTIGTGAQISVVVAGLGRALEAFVAELKLEHTPSLDTIQTAMHEQGLRKVATDLRANPSLSGERYDSSLRGSFTNLSFDNFTIGDMTAALCRGLVTSLRDTLPRGLLDSKREVVGSGNAIGRSPLMQQIIRETFGYKLTLHDSPESTACGAALLVATSLT